MQPPYLRLAKYTAEDGAPVDQPVRYILGDLPPPYDGVTVFLMRRCGQLRRENQPYQMVDWMRMNKAERLRWMLHVWLDPSPAIYEFHGIETMTYLPLLLRPFPKEVVYWIHSGQFTDTMPGWQRWIYERFLKLVDECVLVSNHIYGFFEKNQLALPPNNRVQNAFVPPLLEDEDAIWATYEPETIQFIEDHDPLMVLQGGNAFYLDVDRYGADLAVEMVGRLAEKYPKIGLLIGRSATDDPRFLAYQEDLQQRIQQYGIADHVHFLTGNRELWPLTKRADLFLRPSNQDGDSVAVREAEFFGVPVIASDACWRPDACILFANRDPDDLAAKVEAWMQAREG